MRIVTVVLCVLYAVSFSFSQITITSTDVQALYAVNKGWRSLQSQTLSISMNIGSASSSSQTWIVPTVAWADTMRNDNLVPSATPYASRFPRATHAQRSSYSYSGTIYTSYHYVRLTTDSLIDLGSASRVQESGKDTTYYNMNYLVTTLLPVTFGKTSSRRDSIPIFAGAYIIQRSTETVDAFGSLTVPAGTFQALRTKEVSISETTYPGVPATKDTSTYYSWMTKEGYQIDITTKDRNPGSGSIPITTITYSYLVAGSTGIADQWISLPTDYELYQNYPNPFNPTTAISFSLPKAGDVALKVFDALGQELATIASGERAAGLHTFHWSGEAYPSGIYFYRLSVVPSARRDLVPTEGRNGQAGDASTGSTSSPQAGSARGYVETKKMILLR